MKTKKVQALDKLETINRCIICATNNYHAFLNVPDRNYVTGNFTYVQCDKCGLVWLNPRPTLQVLGNYYPATYPAHKNLKSLNSLQKLVRKIFKKNSHLAHLFIKEQLYYWAPKGKILDVGTGSGIYLNILKEWGWDSYGIELNREAVKKAKKFGIVHIKQGTIHNVNFKHGFFDVIRYSHVLEHVPSPPNDLKVAYKLLKNTGSLIIIVPNINSIFFKLFRSFWYPLEPPRHFYQFSDKTLIKLLKKNKFSNIRIKYIQSPNPVLWSIKYALGMNNVERKLKYTGPIFSLLLLPLNWLHISDVIEVTAQKIKLNQ